MALIALVFTRKKPGPGFLPSNAGKSLPPSGIRNINLDKKEGYHGSNRGSLLLNPTSPYCENWGLLPNTEAMLAKYIIKKITTPAIINIAKTVGSSTNMRIRFANPQSFAGLKNVVKNCIQVIKRKGINILTSNIFNVKVLLLIFAIFGSNLKLTIFLISELLLLFGKN